MSDTEPAFVRNNGRRPMHARLDARVGDWTVERTLCFAVATLRQRTVITVESPDRHVFEMYVTAAGKPEQLADRMVCTRR